MILLVRDLMTIGVPVCRDSESCGVVVRRLTPEMSVVAVLDEDGRACGWATQKHLLENPFRLTGDVMDDPGDWAAAVISARYAAM